jgi:extracellular factor (EF) 3-hydroxypalmitic acid methyl ester biosynthesis protein
MIDAYFPIIFDFQSKKTETAAPSEPDNEPKALNFLTQEDWRLLVEKSSLESYPKGKEILAKEAQRRAIFIIEKGTVRVEREPGNVIARRGPGVVFGEMSFLENKGASAAVVADSDVDVSVIDEAYLYALLASVPGLATRFYQTLAVTLAHRLREASDQLARQ